MANSATEPWNSYVALLVFFPAFLLLRSLALSTSWFLASAVAVPAAVIIILEALFTRPAARSQQQQQQHPRLQFQHWSPTPTVICYKTVGLASILASIGCTQCILYEYSKEFYRPWFDILIDVGPVATVACVLYVVAAGGYQTDASAKEDMFHNLGRLLLKQPMACPMPASRWRSLAREWLVKAFFLPLMTSACAHSLLGFDNTVERFKELVAAGGFAFGPLYSTLHDAIFLVDVVWATFGYMLSCTLLDSHVRSVEPTVLGWAVALACYQPFNASVVDAYFAFGGPGNNWQEYLLLLGAPTWCLGLWGGCVLVLISIYSWSTVVFGLRFSNLTNRGIITSGPYRFTRHPAYLAKNISWWLVNVPWSTHDGIQMAFKRCVRLTAVNVLYAARAWTEEQHLLQDPAYVDYYNAMQQRYGLPQVPDQQQQPQPVL